MKGCKFPGSRPIGKPRDWDNALDGECGTIHVADNVDVLSGQNVMFSCYQLSETEIEALKNGGLLRLGIMGEVHPVFSLNVLSPKIAEMVQPEPVLDMGGVIDG